MSNKPIIVEGKELKTASGPDKELLQRAKSKIKSRMPNKGASDYHKAFAEFRAKNKDKNISLSQLMKDFSPVWQKIKASK